MGTLGTVVQRMPGTASGLRRALVLEFEIDESRDQGTVGALYDLRRGSGFLCQRAHLDDDLLDPLRRTNCVLIGLQRSRGDYAPLSLRNQRHDLAIKTVDFLPDSREAECIIRWTKVHRRSLRAKFTAAMSLSTTGSHALLPAQGVPSRSDECLRVINPREVPRITLDLEVCGGEQRSELPHHVDRQPHVDGPARMATGTRRPARAAVVEIGSKAPSAPNAATATELRAAFIWAS